MEMYTFLILDVEWKNIHPYESFQTRYLYFSLKLENFINSKQLNYESINIYEFPPGHVALKMEYRKTKL